MNQPNLQTLHDRRLARQSAMKASGNTVVQKQVDAWLRSMEPLIDRMVDLAVQAPEVIGEKGEERDVLETARIELFELANNTHGERKGLTAIVNSVREDMAPVNPDLPSSQKRRQPLPVLGQLIRNLQKIPEMAIQLAFSPSSYSIGYVLPSASPEVAVGLPSEEVFFQTEKAARLARNEADAQGVRSAVTTFMHRAATGIFATAENRFNNKNESNSQPDPKKAKL